MTKMAVMSIYVLNTLWRSSLEPVVRFQFWYVASGTQAHHSLFKHKPGLTLTHFKARSNFATWAFVLENMIIIDSLEFFSSLEVG